MRVAALYDIHGNLPALEAVLHEVRQIGVDQIVVGGDIFPGPMSRECLDYLSDLDLPIEFIRGNCEDDVLAQMSGTEGRDMPERFREIFHWSAAQLSPEYRQVLASWPLTLQLSVDGLGEVLFCHATPRDINQIFTRETAEAVISAGAAFVVSPTFDRRVIEACHRHDIAVMPGCMTPTEIHAAWSAGADIVKLFPATSLGPSFIKDVRGPLPDVRLMPTGGVSCENAGSWIRAGAVAVGIGTALVNPTAVLAGDLSGISERARQISDAVAAARGGALTSA